MPATRNGFRLSITQSLMLAALVALLIGAGSASWRGAQTEDLLAPCLSPDGRRVAAATPDGRIHVWNLASLRPHRVHTGIRIQPEWNWASSLVFVDPHTVAFYQDGAPLGQPHSSVQKWDVRTATLAGEVRLAGSPTMVVFAEDGSTFAVFNMATNTVDVWDIDGEAPRHKFKLPSRPNEVLLSGNGELLVVTDAFRRTAGIYDAGGGRMLRSMPLGNRSPQVFPSSQGKWVATLELVESRVDHWKWEIRVHDAVRQRTVSSVKVDGFPPSLRFAPDDESYVCVMEGQASRWFDVGSGKQLGTLDDQGQTFKDYAFTADGEQLVGLADGQLALWDLQSGERRKIIWQKLATLNMLLFGGAFILWGLGWGWLSRRHRTRTRHGPHAAVPDAPVKADPAALTASLDAGVPHETARKPSDSPKRPPSVVRSLLLLTLMMALVMVLLTLTMTGPAWQRVLLIVGGTAGLVAAVFALAIGYVLARELCTRGYDNALSRAVQCAGRPGRLYQHGRWTAWFVGNATLEGRFAQEVDRAEQRVRELVGPHDFERPALIVDFDDHGQFQRYAGRALPLAGVYYGWFKKQLVISETYARQHLTDPVRTLRTLLAYHLLLDCKRFWLPPWLQNVLNADVMRDEADSWEQHALRCAHRRLRLATDPQRLPGTDWFRWNRRQFTRQVLQSDDRERSRATLVALDMGLSLHAYLLGSDSGPRRERFLGFVRQLEKGDDVEAKLVEHYGCGYDQLFSDWQRWLLDQPTESRQQPADWRHRELVEHLLPIIRNPAGDGQVRTRTISVLGAAGYVATAEPLIERLRQPTEPQREEIVEALRQIAGRSWGDDPDTWQRWWESHDEATRSLPPLLLDIPPVTAPNSVEQTPEAAEHSSGGTETPAATATPIPFPKPSDSAIAPAGVRQAWTLMLIGGVTAITLAMLMLFGGGLWWLPTVYVGILVGVLALSRSSAKAPDGLRTTAALQAGNVINCDVFNLVLGLVTLFLLRDPAAKEFLGNRRLPRR